LGVESAPRESSLALYHTTGLSRDEIVELCALIHSAEKSPEDKRWPPSLGLFRSVIVTLAYLRRNRVQQELAEAFATSQPTISRAISAVTPLIRKVLAPYVPTADDLDERCQYLVDGTLLPCWSWAAHPELYSGKHKTTGMNIQVACTGVGLGVQEGSVVLFKGGWCDVEYWSGSATAEPVMEAPGYPDGLTAEEFGQLLDSFIHRFR
jgi:hypothetical protein